jgi:hypothetical protein
MRNRLDSFVAKNSDLAAELRQAPTWKDTRQPTNRKAFGYIDFKAVEKYENNWDIIR